ncbi:GxxExxY protein [Flaviaesturariibacter amylovorans]|uniref:GxxExxY protein n=2 Tax=Flaviaesturariibacter amylovorans TaxID=1084520 RepID=A0ABP8HQM8_9BACT
MVLLTENQIADSILDCAFKIHRRLGPGLLESVYEEILCYELRKLGFFVERQKNITLIYDELVIPRSFRADLIVERLVLVELKSAIDLHKEYYKVLSTYLTVTHIRLGLLINFGAPLLKDGIRRIANGL